MRLVCPCCGGQFSIEAALADEAARRAVATALMLPAPLGDRVLRYIGLFRPQARGLSWDRTARLLDELLVQMQAGTVTRDGQARPAPHAYWEQALDEMLGKRDKLHLPLKSHGYLFEIVAGYADKAEAKAETRREIQRREQPAGRRRASMASIGSHISDMKKAIK